MKILFLTQLPPPVHGASVINQSIKDSLFINSSFDATYVDIASAQGVADIGHMSFRKILKSVSIFLAAIIAYLKVRPDIVYLTLSPIGVGFYKDALIALTLKVAGAKLTYHLHGKGIKSASARSRLSALIYRAVFSNVDVIHLSESLIVDIAHLVPRNRIHIVNNGIAATDGPNHKKQPSDSPIYFLYLSNLAHDKGPLDVLLACDQLKELKKNFNVVFAGRFRNEKFEKEFRQKFSEFAPSNVTLLDQGAYGPEKQKLLDQCNVMILPTYYSHECFPLTLLEAMSARMAIISTDEGAIGDLVTVGVNGLLVQKRNPTDIARAMVFFINNPDEAIRMGENGYRRYCERYTLEAFEHRLLSVLQHITARH